MTEVMLCAGLLTSHELRPQVSKASRGNKLSTETFPVEKSGSVRRPATTENLDGQECPSTAKSCTTKPAKTTPTANGLTLATSCQGRSHHETCGRRVTVDVKNGIPVSNVFVYPAIHPRNRRSKPKRACHCGSRGGRKKCCQNPIRRINIGQSPGIPKSEVPENTR